MKFLLLISSLISYNLFAHGDHGTPGAYPPAPNGGVIVEAKHNHAKSHSHDHGEASAREIFYEAKYNGKTIEVYPLELNQKTHDSFDTLNISKFSHVKIIVKDPRKKTTVASTFQSSKASWTIDASKINSRRLIISVSSEFDGANYKADIQVERK